MIASKLSLSLSDLKALRVTDRYSIHRIVFDLFEDIRSEEEKKKSVSSGILFADKGGDRNERNILILSNRSPKTPERGDIQSVEIAPEFLDFSQYRFDVELNPTTRDGKSRKLIPVRSRSGIENWFLSKSEESWGFSVVSETLEVGSLAVKNSETKNNKITHGSAKLSGVLNVKDKEIFKRSFCQGIGRGRAFGMGLLQIVPIVSQKEN